MYLMSPSLVTGSAVTPVSSCTSLRAVSNGFSPGSTNPLGSAKTGFALLPPRRDDLVSTLDWSPGGSIAAIHQLSSRFRMTTPPADISRTIGCKLTEQQELVTVRRDLLRLPPPRSYRLQVLKVM